MPFDLQILNADSGKFETLPSTWGIGGRFTIKQSTTVKGEGSASGFIELKQVETQAGGYMSYPYNNNSQPRYARLIGDNIGGGSSTNFLKANGFTNDKTSYLKVKIGYQDFNSNISNDANWWVFAPGFRTGETLNDWLNGNMTLETRQRLGKNLTQIAQPSPISSNLLFTELIIRVVDNDFDGVPIIPIIFGTTESLNAQQFAAQVEGFRFFIDQAEQVIYDKITVSGIITNNTNVTNPNGAIDVTIAGGSPDGVTISWNTGESTEDLTGIDQGLYIITVTDNLTGDQVIKEFIVEDDLLDPIVITETKTNPSSPNGNDGSIQLTITGGSGQFSYNWDNGEITKDLSDLTAGDYTITVTDQENGVFESKTITLSDPSEEELDAPLIIYPKANAIRMIKQQEYNASNNPKNSQNSLYCDFKSQNIRRAFYAQPYLKDDLPKIQFQSNINELNLQVQNESGDFIKTLVINKVFDSDSTSQEFQMNLFVSNIDGRTSLTFGGDGSIPNGLTPTQGNKIQIQNSGNSALDGFYTIQDVTSESIPRVIVSNSNPIPATLTADVKFFSSAQILNIYQSTIDLRDKPNGLYILKLQALSDDGNLIYNSELLDFRDQFDDDTQLINYQNNDNYFRINYNFDIEMKLRVKGRLFYEEPGADKEVMQDCDFDDVILRAVPSMTITLNVLEAPYYIHRIANLAFSHDIVSVQGIDFSTGESYSVEPINDLYGLINGSMKLKQKDYANEFNDIDSGGIGDIDEQNIIGQNDGLLGY